MAIAAIVGYLLGSFPTAVLVGRLRQVDPRERGDGNPGWWNMRGLVGDRLAALVMCGDLLKGALAAGVGIALWGPWWTAYVGVLFAMIGHAFPVWGDFRGGRSVLTFVGGMLVISPTPVLISALLGLVFTLGFRHLIIGGRVAIFSFPVIQAFFEPRSHVFVTLGLMSFIALRFLLASAPPAPQSASHSWRRPHPWMER